MTILANMNTAQKAEFAAAIIASAGVGLAPYLGQVSASSLPNNISTGFKSGNGQIPRVAASRITQPRLAFANWYQNSTVHEAGTGGTATFSASIQYPISATPATGTWQAITWGGAATVTAADGATTALSDPLTLTTPIPAGAAYLIRWHVEATAQIAFYNFTGLNTFIPNQLCEANATAGALADKTSGGTIAAGTSANNVFPVLIVDTTTRPSFYMGPTDSRVFGLQDLMDASGHIGELARSIGGQYGYINAGCPSETLQGWLLGYTRRSALAQYCSHVIGQNGINDNAAGRTAAQVAADITTATAVFTGMGKTVQWTTLPPISTSTDGWATTANQTVSNFNAARTALNDILRSGQIAGLSGTIDIASVVESGLNSGLWTPLATNDGIHENYLGNQLIKRSRVVASATAARP